MNETTGMPLVPTRAETIANGHLFQLRDLLEQTSAMRNEWQAERDAHARQRQQSERANADLASQVVELRRLLAERDESVHTLEGATAYWRHQVTDLQDKLKAQYAEIEERAKHLEGDGDDECANTVALEINRMLVAFRVNVFNDEHLMDIPF